VFIGPHHLVDGLGKAPSDYPPELQGVIWMDQAGVISDSDIGSSAAPDGAISLGDPVNKLDTTTNSIFVDTVGTAWLWFNSILGYHEWFDIKFGSGLKGDQWYRFQFNDDYSFAQIYLAYTPLHLEIPKTILSFSMTRQTPPKDACPPSRAASKAAFTKCATWRRESSIGFLPLKPWIYYAFEVVDNKGRPVQPYFDKFLEHLFNQTQGNSTAAKEVGLTWKTSDAKIPKAYGFVGAESAVGQRASLGVWWAVWLSFLVFVVLCCGTCFQGCYRAYRQRTRGRAYGREIQHGVKPLLSG